MAKNKLTTKDILAAARAEAAKADGGAPADETVEVETAATPAVPAEDAADDVAAEETEAPAPAVPKEPAAAPKSTADILAAARAQASDRGKPAGTKPATAEESAPAKPSAAKKTPSSTADILAAARSQSASGAAADDQPAAKKSAAKASPKAPATAKPSGNKPSVQEMLKAVREGKSAAAAGVAGVAAAATTDAPSKPKLPPTPQKPSAAKKKPAGGADIGRRNVVFALVATPFAIAWTALSATAGAALLATARFMFPNVLVEPPTRFKIGPPSDYPLGTVSAKWKAARGIWVIHTEQYKGRNLIYALASVCTHLGCTPNWLEGEQKFKCPCHGSGFYINGINFEGPAPRPLERVGISLASDGMLEVDKSVKFQEEMGQWEEAASYVDGTV